MSNPFCQRKRSSTAHIHIRTAPISAYNSKTIPSFAFQCFNSKNQSNNKKLFAVSLFIYLKNH